MRAPGPGPGSAAPGFARARAEVPTAKKEASVEGADSDEEEVDFAAEGSGKPRLEVLVAEQPKGRKMPTEKKRVWS